MMTLIKNNCIQAFSNINQSDTQNIKEYLPSELLRTNWYGLNLGYIQLSSAILPENTGRPRF